MRNVLLSSVLALSFIGCSIVTEDPGSEGGMGGAALSGAPNGAPNDGPAVDDENKAPTGVPTNMQQGSLSSSSGAPAPSSTGTTPPASQPCVRTTTPKAGFTQTPRTLTVGTASRKFLLVVPNDYDNCKKYPVVLALHGDGDTGTNFHSWMTFEKVSGSDALLIYPDGTNNTWNLTREPSSNNDIQFLLAALADVGKSFALDTKRVYATGFSSGGFMSNALACQASNVIRAIASNSGGAPFNQTQKWPATGWDKCNGQSPVATLHIHGGSDTTVPTASGRFAAQYWASVNGCGTTMTQVASNASCKVYAGCPAGKAVEYCEVAGMIHTEWDQTPAVAWAFFKAQN